MFVEFLGCIDFDLPYRDWQWVDGVVIRIVDNLRVEVEYGMVDRREIITIREVPRYKISTIRVSERPVFAMSIRDNWLDRYNEPDTDQTWRVPNMNMDLFKVLEQAGYVTPDMGDGAWGFTDKGRNELGTEVRSILIKRLFDEIALGAFGKAEAMILREAGFDSKGFPYVGDNW